MCVYSGLVDSVFYLGLWVAGKTEIFGSVYDCLDSGWLVCVAYLLTHLIKLRKLSWCASEPVEGFGLSCCGCWAIFTSQHLRKNTHCSRFRGM